MFGFFGQKDKEAKKDNGKDKTTKKSFGKLSFFGGSICG